MKGMLHNVKMLFFVRAEGANSSLLRVSAFPGGRGVGGTGLTPTTTATRGTGFLCRRPLVVTGSSPGGRMSCRKDSVTSLNSQERPVNV